MTLAALLNRACTVTHVAQTATADRYNDPTEATSTTATTCYVEQRQASEDTAGLVVGAEDWLGMFPVGTAIDANDRVTVDGMAFEVDGPTWPVANPRTQATNHVEANLRRTT